MSAKVSTEKSDCNEFLDVALLTINQLLFDYEVLDLNEQDFLAEDDNGRNFEEKTAKLQAALDLTNEAIDRLCQDSQLQHRLPEFSKLLYRVSTINE